VDQLRDGRLAEESDPNRSERDAQLAGRQVFADLFDLAQRELRAAIPIGSCGGGWGGWTVPKLTRPPSRQRTLADAGRASGGWSRGFVMGCRALQLVSAAPLSETWSLVVARALYLIKRRSGWLLFSSVSGVVLSGGGGTLATCR
jgi:hypothetical protein